jgi:hypothetical protein
MRFKIQSLLTDPRTITPNNYDYDILIYDENAPKGPKFNKKDNYTAFYHISSFGNNYINWNYDPFQQTTEQRKLIADYIQKNEKNFIQAAQKIFIAKKGSELNLKKLQQKYKF